jgi:hypothetical protein
MDHRINPHAGSRLRRLAAFTPIAIWVVLVGCTVAAAAPRHLATSDPNPTPGLQTAAEQTAAEDELEEEAEWEWGESEEEEIEVELEYEEGNESGMTEGVYAPPECMLQDAKARVVASNARDTLRLVLHYASRESAHVTVHYWLTGARGPMRLEPLRRHTNRHGTIGHTVHPSDRQMARVRAAHTFVVHVDVPGAPAYCERYATLRLSAKQRGRARTVWEEPGRTARRPVTPRP